MKNFEYNQPRNLKEASTILQEHPGVALPYAGGTDLLGLMKDGVVEPAQLVNLKNLSELKGIAYRPGKGLEIGALTTLSEIVDSREIAENFPLLVQTARQVASPQLRNVGTLGGNLCQRPRCWYFRGDFPCLRKGGEICYAVDGENKFHCVIGGGPCYIVHPSDMAVALLAYDARVEIQAGKKSRQISLKDFFVLPQENYLHENILKPGEILTRVVVPEQAAGARTLFLKIQERQVWDFATVSLAVVLWTKDRQVEKGRVVLGGVAPVPWLEETVSRRLTGITIEETTINNLADSLLKEAEPLEQNAYKVILARNLFKQAMQEII